MQREELQSAIDLVITSPPYNVSRSGASDVYNSRYKVYSDSISNESYIDWSINVFNHYDKILKPNGVVLYNLSYSSENTSMMWLVISAIIQNTSFTTADCIVWKKKSAIPNNRSKNKLTRIVEFIFVFVRKSELETFNANKKIISRIERTGQANYENVFNFIEAKNNDGNNDLNKATFSTDLVCKLLDMYAQPNSIIYDSFMGIGTTAKGCLNMGFEYVGSELDPDQISHFENWKKLQYPTSLEKLF